MARLCLGQEDCDKSMSTIESICLNAAAQKRITLTGRIESIHQSPARSKFQVLSP